MEQLTLCPPPYKYIIDTYSLLDQKDNRKYNRTIHKTLWNNIEQLIKGKEIIVCAEISNEIKKDDTLGDYLSLNQCEVLEATESIQAKVVEIVNKCPHLLNFKKGTGKSSGDVFLIATAMVYKLTIITEEKQDAIGKIPDIASQFGIGSININGLCDKESWVF
ncbi:MAG: DUF4411 family protein [Oscillospiraceae bacterium]|jgi:hypothetical protein|nr:DUF4411 family protein [Oscillospiraceae bacterium]